MSRSPERMSSYRRCFEYTEAAVSAYQPRASSPSPTRRETRHRSASFTRSGGRKIMGQRALTTKPHLTSSASLGALCLDVSTGPGTSLDAAVAENQAFKLTRTNERQEMVVLNDRLAVYIEKVRTLESKNSLLEADIEALKSSYERSAGLRQLYVSQLKELNRQAEQMREQRDLSLEAKKAKLVQLDMLKAQYDEALNARKQTELEIETLRPDVDKSTSTQLTLEKQLENLDIELAFLQKVHKEEIEELMQQIYSAASKTDLTFGLPDLSSALMQIQSQYESIASKNLQEMDTWYKSKLQDLNDASTKHVETVRSLREEIAGYRKKILNKERELESLKTRNENLEAQMRDALKKYKEEEEDMEDHMEGIKADLKLTKQKTALLMREYQELLNAKMALEIEIITYRKLIEGEDSRLNTLVGNLSLAGGLRLTSSEFHGTSAATASASDSSALVKTLKLDGGPGDASRSKAVKAPAAGCVDSVSPDNQSDENSQNQSSEMSERTVLIRTVTTDEDTYENYAQQCTITISGEVEDADEE